MNGHKTKKLLYAIIPVALFGFIVSYLLWYIIFETPQHGYTLDFDGAQWISTGKETPHGYFIKELHISDNVANAWIVTAATDEVTLFVNKEEISTDTFESLNVSGIHDITGTLRSGKNIIAASIERKSYPGSPKLLLKGVYVDLSGREHVFVTDATWRVSSVEETQGQGEIRWHSGQFDHSLWKKAKIEGMPATYSIYPSPAAPYILGEAPSGYWIWYPNQKVRAAYFMKSFEIKESAKDAIIGIAGISTYDLTVNGVTVKEDRIFNNNLEVYDITPLVHSGENTIGIGVRAPETIPALFVEGYVSDNNSKIYLRSDATWRSIAHLAPDKYVPDVKSDEWKVPLLLAKYPYPPWGILSKKLLDIDLPLSFTASRTLKFYSFTSGIIAIMLFLWLMISFLRSRFKKNVLEDNLLLDGLLHIPSLLFMFLIYLFKFDVRYDPSFPFQSKFVFFSLLILFLLRVTEFVSVPARNWKPKFLEIENKKLSNLFFLSFLVVLIISGFLIRMHKLDYTSLSHDEVTIMQFIDGFFTRGFPSKVVGPYIKPMTTYELLPYSASLPLILFGFNDFAARLHSVLWGTFEIAFIFLLGKNLFNRSTGFVAAAIYTFHPWCINWSQNVTYPQLTQALATLTALFFYKSINSNPISKKFLYLTAIMFSLMYLSWEGSGFFLIGMFIAIIAHKGSDLSWLKNKHLWIGFAIIFLTVLIQQSRRILYQMPYLVIGSRVAEISTPTLFFLDPMYNPYFYIDRFFFTENNWMLTAVLIAGILYIFKNRPLRYLYILPISVVFLLTNFFAASSIRYTYYLEPFLILIGSAVIFMYFDTLKSYLDGKNLVMRSFISFNAIAMSLILFMASNNTLMDLYLLSKNPPKNPFNPPVYVRQNIYWDDYKSSSEYIMQHIKKGDTFFVMMPHTLDYYAGSKGNYNLSTLISKNGMTFDITEAYPGLLDKYVGNPIVIGFDQFREIAGKNNRVWVIAVPNTSLEKDNDDETMNYIVKNFKVVYESYNAKVYLWAK